jgi:hypothetical protein
VCISTKPWFSTDCKIARKQYRKLKRRCKIDPSIETKEDMNRAVKEYKKKMDANIKMHRKEKSRKIKKKTQKVNQSIYLVVFLLVPCRKIFQLII